MDNSRTTFIQKHFRHKENVQTSTFLLFIILLIRNKSQQESFMKVHTYIYNFFVRGVGH